MTNQRTKQVATVIGTLVLTFLILFAGQIVARRATVTQPLYQLYRSLPFVTHYQINNQSGLTQITVTMNRVPDLQSTYDQLNAKTGRILPTGTFTIRVRGNSSPALDNLANQAELAVEQAKMTGGFVQMAQEIQQDAARSHAQAQVWVDGQYVYLTLMQGSHYFYKVFGRQAVLATLTGGGGTSG